MASLTLGFVGTAIGGPIGGFIGSTIGSFIDNLLFAPKIEGPRLSDLSVTSSAYGQAIPQIYGPENRVGGNIIWSTGLVEHKKTKRAGKGGPKQTTYSYTTSLAILLGEGELPAGLKRIWANSKKIFDVNDATVPIGAPTASVGMVATRANGTHAVFDTLRYYVGNATQQIDPTIEADLGVGTTPAYRHSAYLVIKDLELADFGNAIPNMEFEFEGKGGTSVAAWLQDIATLCGIEHPNFSAVSVTNTGRGYIVARPVTGYGAMEPLGVAYNFELAEKNGQITCVRRGRRMVAVIPLGECGASSSGLPDTTDLVTIETEPPFLMPQEVAVTFRDADLDYQQNSQRALRQSGHAENNVSRELALTMDVDEARQLADTMLWDAWTARRTGSTKVSEKWLWLQPGTVVGLEAANRILPFQLQRATRGADGVIALEARAEDIEPYLSNALGAAGYLPPNQLQLPGPTDLVLMDTALLRDTDDDTGFYWSATGEGSGWRGADILRSSDGGVTYSSMSQVTAGSAMGTVAVALPSGPSDTWDMANTLTVVLLNPNDELESLSDTLVLNGANAAWLGPANGQGGELIQFTTATLTAPGTYQLSGLLRGRKGTDYAIGTHGAGEFFVLLTPDALGRSDYGASDWNAARLYKPVSALTTEADTASQSFTNTGESKRPISPVGAAGSRDGANNLTITWMRRSRLEGAGLFGGDPPLGETTEAYEVDVIVGGVPVRTIAVTAPTASYTAAEQTADGITPGNPVTVDIYQMSEIRGRGHARRAIV